MDDRAWGMLYASIYGQHKWAGGGQRLELANWGLS